MFGFVVHAGIGPGVDDFLYRGLYMNRKISIENEQNVISMYLDYMPIIDIAKLFGLSTSSIHAILKRNSIKEYTRSEYNKHCREKKNPCQGQNVQI